MADKFDLEIGGDASKLLRELDKVVRGGASVDKAIERLTKGQVTYNAALKRYYDHEAKQIISAQRAQEIAINAHAAAARRLAAEEEKAAAKARELKAARDAEKAATKAAAEEKKRLAAVEAEAQKGTNRTRQGVFALGQALNDAQQFQYGFRQGLIATSNQLPQLIEGLAGGAAAGSRLAAAIPYVTLAMSAAATIAVVFGDDIARAFRKGEDGAREFAKEVRQARRDVEDFFAKAPGMSGAELFSGATGFSQDAAVSGAQAAAIGRKIAEIQRRGAYTASPATSIDAFGLETGRQTTKFTANVFDEEGPDGEPKRLNYEQAIATLIAQQNSLIGRQDVLIRGAESGQALAAQKLSGRVQAQQDLVDRMVDEGAETAELATARTELLRLEEEERKLRGERTDAERDALKGQRDAERELRKELEKSWTFYQHNVAEWKREGSEIAKIAANVNATFTELPRRKRPTSTTGYDPRGSGVPMKRDIDGNWVQDTEAMGLPQDKLYEVGKSEDVAWTGYVNNFLRDNVIMAEAASLTAGTIAESFSTAFELTGKKSKALFRIFQVASAGEAIANSIVASQKVMGQLGVFGPPVAALMVAGGVAAAAKIMSLSPDSATGGGGGGYSSGNVTRNLGPEPKKGTSSGWVATGSYAQTSTAYVPPGAGMQNARTIRLELTGGVDATQIKLAVARSDAEDIEIGRAA